MERHLDVGTLRRLADEPNYGMDTQRTHLAGCKACSASLEEIRTDAQAAAAAFSQATPTFDPAPAWSSMSASAKPARSWVPTLRWPGRPLLTSPAAVLLVACLLVGGMGTALASGALNPIFGPAKTVETVPVSQGSVGAIPDLSAYGTVHWTSKPDPHSVADAQAAATESGLPVLTPSNLPATITGAPHYGVMDQATGSFTFSAAKARAEAAREGRSLPPMPKSIDGSTLVVTVGPAVVEFYGSPSESELPSLVIAESRSPVVTSSGATVTQLENYLLEQPGISPQLAQEIRSIGDPTTTLPIPIPVDKATSKNVTVQGVNGVLVGDNSGLGSAVIWVKNGIVYAVGGTLHQDQVLAVANSLK